VISDKPILDYLPLHRPTSGSEETPIKTVTQFEMGVLASLGMLKVDILGLITLTVMQRACQMIEKRHGVKLHLNNIPLDDPKAFELLGSGHTAGVFQVEGGGMTRFLVQMKPDKLDHIIAMVALYRPGPMNFIQTYIDRMQARARSVTCTPRWHPSSILHMDSGLPGTADAGGGRAGGYTPSGRTNSEAPSPRRRKEIEKHRQVR
jgi:DNA polymerase-3 subunit alpha